MEIRDFLGAKRQMENDMRNAIMDAITKFYQTTGFTPSNVNVYLLENATIGKDRQYVVSEVRTDVLFE